MKKRYIIYTEHFQPNIGGVVALHKLCHDLNFLGENSFVTTPYSHPSLKTPYISLEDLKEEDIIIYPEIIGKNFLKPKNVVRWVLNTPGVSSDESNFYSGLLHTDLIFKYSDYFTVRQESMSKGLLTTTFVDTNIFHNKEKKIRNGSAFLIKKGGMPIKVHPDNSILIQDYMQSNWQLMADLFRQIEFFYCYDNACFWVVLAAMCGTIPVVVPNSDMKAEEWYDKFPHKQCGIAYGFDKIQHAKDSQHLVYENLQLFYNKQLNTVKNFIKICETSFL